MKLKVHPLAEMIPAMSEEEFAELKADIEANGQAEPIVLYRGEVLDGRHRSRACEELGIQPLIREYTGDQPAAYVLSLNVKRRNLTPSQRAAVVVEFLPQLEAEAKKRMSHPGNDHRNRVGPRTQADPPNPHRAREDAGALVGVSGATVDRARRVKEKAPEEFERIKAGELTAREASDKLAQGDIPPKPPVPKREASVSAKRLHNLVHTFTNTQTLLRETNVDAAMQKIDPKEATEWAQQLRSVRTDLTKLVTALEACA